MRILVVDDNNALLESLDIGLRLYNFDVEIATNGFDALEKLSKEPFDVLLSDVHMPGMSGVSLAGTVRTRFPDVHILLMSIDPSMLQNSPFQSIGKPFEIDELYAQIEACWNV